MNTQEIRIGYQELDQFTTDILHATGVPTNHAKSVTDVLSLANIRGVETHGTDMLPIYLDRIRNGAINPNPKMKIIRQNIATALIDGDNGLGHVTSVFAMKEAIKKARHAGVSWVNVTNSNHQGALAYYSLMATKEGMAGITMSTTTPIMAPWGSKEPIAPNTPMAYALPSDQYAPPILDMASSVLAHGRIRLSKEKGIEVPDGLAIDASGNTTVDPEMAIASLPFGAYKGSGLVMIFSALAGLLGGSPFAALRPLADGQGSANIGHLLIAIDIEAFTDLGKFKTDLDQVITQWKNSAKRPAVNEVFYPGEIEWRRVDERKQNGIPLNHELEANLRKHSVELDVPFPNAICE